MSEATIILPRPLFNYSYFDGLYLGMKLSYPPSDGRKLRSKPNNTVETLQILLNDKSIFVSVTGVVASSGDF